MVVGGVLGFVAAWFQGRQGLAAAREDRLHTRRADAYVMLSELLVRFRQDALAVGKGPETPLVIDLDRWFEVEARLESFGSKEVILGYQGLVSARQRLTALRHEWAEELEERNAGVPRSAEDRLYTKELRNSLVEVRTDVMQRTNSLLEQLRHESRGGAK